MATPMLLAKHFASVCDPRRARRRKHELLDIIALTICAVICGADDWQEIEQFGKAQHDWLRGFLRLPNGIPSHDTIERVFAAMNPRQFEAAFRSWTTGVADSTSLKHVAIDGKTLRGRGCPTGLQRLHLVSAWCVEQHLSLGQVATDAKSNEITAIPELLRLLDLQGALVTLDAMGCQKDIAQQIVEGGADYVLTVKANQPTLHDAIEAKFVCGYQSEYAGMGVDQFGTEERHHGRVERRSYTILTDTKGIDPDGAWSGLKVIGVCYSEREEQGKVSEELRYFIGSRAGSAREYAGWLRGHWGIENNLHWQLDVTFSEDYSRERDANANQNLAVVRKLVLTALKRHPGKKSIKCKRFHAALDSSFREEVLDIVLK